MKDILVLGIESSCDETSVAIVKNGREIISNIIDTQIPIHEKYGGVVPEIASRNHIEAISRVVKLALEEANVKFKDIQFNKDILVATIVRNNNIIIPTGDDFLKVNDRVIIITKNINLLHIDGIFAGGVL